MKFRVEKLKQAEKEIGNIQSEIKGTLQYLERIYSLSKKEKIDFLPDNIKNAAHQLPNKNIANFLIIPPTIPFLPKPNIESTKTIIPAHSFLYLKPVFSSIFCFFFLATLSHLTFHFAE